jgi:hypothetical protein
VYITSSSIPYKLQCTLQAAIYITTAVPLSHEHSMAQSTHATDHRIARDKSESVLGVIQLFIQSFIHTEWNE